MLLFLQKKKCFPCDQPRVLDIAARGGRKVDTLPAAILDDVMARVVTIFL